ncbi:MAG: chalcone isomerase family protein [Gallionellaceae bacterium]
MNKLFLIITLCFSLQASALEIEGAKFAESIKVENATLVLNSAGTRKIVFFKMYAIGLYLAEKQSNADLILADSQSKRIALSVLVDDGETQRFLNGFRRGIEKNHSEAQLAALSERLANFDKLFSPVKTVKKYDVVSFDWLPNEGTRVALNGAELGEIAGEDFYRALLSIWLGNKPVSDDLKRNLLSH